MISLAIIINTVSVRMLREFANNDMVAYETSNNSLFP